MCDVTLCRDSRYIKKYVLCVYFSYAVGCSAVGCSAVGLSSLVFNSVVLPKPITTCLSAHCWSVRLLHICIRASSFSVFVQAFVDVLIIISYSFDVFCSHFSVDLVLFLFNVCLCVYIWKKNVSIIIIDLHFCMRLCVCIKVSEKRKSRQQQHKQERISIRKRHIFISSSDHTYARLAHTRTHTHLSLSYKSTIETDNIYSSLTRSFFFCTLFMAVCIFQKLPKRRR